MPRAITVDKNLAYSIAIHELKNEKKLSKRIEMRSVKYLTNIVEQDQRSIKRIIAPMLSFGLFALQVRFIKGIEDLNMVKKGQIKNLNYSGLNEAKYTNQLFGIVL